MYDAPAHRLRLDYKYSPYPLDPTMLNNVTQIATGEELWMDQNDQCFQLPNFSFDDFFGWIKHSQHVGHHVISNRTCDVYMLERNILCIDGDEPLLLVIKWQLFPLPRNLSGMTTIYFFGSFRRAVDATKLNPSASCGTLPAGCGSGNIETMNFYIFHPRNHFNISGQDVADARGDMSYVCADSLWQAEDYSLGSWYEVRVFQKFGQYANCNFYDPSVCIGGDRFYVGREAPYALGHGAGQCDSSLASRLGTWYSLPVDGECSGNRTQLGKDCSWQIMRRVKTISMSCLWDKQHQLQNWCHAPFAIATDIFLRAFASEDPAKGGCSHLEVPSALKEVAGNIVV